MTSAMDWDAVERRLRGKTYAARTCPRCERTIREGAWGSRHSNWDRHVAAHDRADARAQIKLLGQSIERLARGKRGP
jgi:hypothetical protein